MPAVVPVPKTWTDGVRVTAADFNTHIRDAFLFALDMPAAMVYRGAVTNIPTGTTGIPYPWDTVVFDNNGMWSATNSTRLYLPTAGRYMVISKQAFGNYATGFRFHSLRLNAAGNPASGTLLDNVWATPVSGANTTLTLWQARSFSANDHVEQFIYQSSGAGQNSIAGVSGGFLMARFLGP